MGEISEMIMVYIIVQLRKQLAKLWRFLKRLNWYKYWKACTSSFRGFRWKYRFCKWKGCRRPECVDSPSFSRIRTADGILHLDLHLHSYKVQITLQLKSTDNLQRRWYVEWVLEKQAVDGNFSNKIFFSDVAHFTLSGYVIKKIVVFAVLRII